MIADSVTVHFLEYTGIGQMLFCSELSCHRKRKRNIKFKKTHKIKQLIMKRNERCPDMEKALENHQTDLPFSFSYVCLVYIARLKYMAYTEFAVIVPRLLLCHLKDTFFCFHFFVLTRALLTHKRINVTVVTPFGQANGVFKRWQGYWFFSF